MTKERIDRTEKRARYRVNMEKYRSTVRRFDYAPAPAALAVIEAAHAAGLDSCLAGVIDRLVLAGGAAISGKTEGLKP